MQDQLKLELAPLLRSKIMTDNIDYKLQSAFFSASNRLGSEILDCIVIGAGASGLKCAHSLVIPDPSSKAYNVLVLEAQNYIGFLL